MLDIFYTFSKGWCEPGPKMEVSMDCPQYQHKELPDEIKQLLKMLASNIAQLQAKSATKDSLNTLLISQQL